LGLLALRVEVSCSVWLCSLWNNRVIHQLKNNRLLDGIQLMWNQNLPRRTPDVLCERIGSRHAIFIIQMCN
jgi:hypothetical protein